ncbi:AMP-dependent synthetase [Archaeoglobales archaeon]|nr:MAG: AMP-dependent synthetase [Archaeoglobales archaeon]HDM60030.1 AMP-dependent synthetase [Archaeoglobus veneficus]
MNRNIINRLAFGDVLRRNAKRFGDREAIVVFGELDREGLEKKLTYREADEKANQFANALIERGMKKGDRVAMIMGNSAEFVLCQFGAAKAGATVVPINPVITSRDIEYQLKHSESKFAVVDDIFLPKIKDILKNLGIDYIVVPISGNAEHETFKEFIKGMPKEEPEVEIWERDILEILYTSGTTALPKGVMLSHLNVIFGCLNATLDGAMIGFANPDAVATTLMPLFHCAQQAITYGVAIIPGGKTVVMRGFDPETLLRAIEKERITFTFMLPTMYRIILDMDLSNYDLSSWKYALYAMTPMDERTKRRLIEELGLTIMLGTGQTEAFPPTSIFRPEHQLEKEGNYWGTPCYFTEHAIMDDEGNLLSENQIGEIVLRGPNVMEGYLKNEEATAEASKYGWHHMGDLGFFDEDGLLKFVDRKKDMIKTGGENVPSIKVESVILAHPKVAEAAVIGLPHERWGEAVTAVVVPKDPSLTEDELIKYCKEHLAGFEVPKKVIFVSEMPKTATGKIQKYQLRERYEDLYKATK